MSDDKQSREGLILRVLWMILFGIVWQLAELALLVVVLAQLVLRLINGVPSRALQTFGDSLSQYLAQIGRFGCFHSEEKPWPFSDWPAAREPEGDAASPQAPAPAAASPSSATAASKEPAVGVETAADGGETAAAAQEEPPRSGSAAEATEAKMEKEEERDAPAEPKA